MAKDSQATSREEENVQWTSSDIEGHVPAMTDVDRQTPAEEGKPVPAIADVTKEKIKGTIDTNNSDMLATVIKFEQEVLEEAKKAAKPDPKILAKILEARAKAMVELIGKNAEKKQRVEDFWNRGAVRLRKVGEGAGNLVGGALGKVVGPIWRGICAAIPTGIQAWRRAWRGGKQDLDKHD